MSGIRDVYPGSEFFPSRTRIKEFQFFNPKWFLSYRKYDPDCSSQILIFTHAGSRGQQSTGSRIQIRYTVTRNLNLYHPARIMVPKGIIDVAGPGIYQI
jgi:hypothetical protein